MVKFKKNFKKSSKVWLNRHSNDLFVKKSKQEGYRSRAAYKLLELQEKYSLFRPGMLVVDLGAAPGSWSQVAIKFIAPHGHKLKGKLFAVDILPIEPIENVDIINGDFSNELIFQQICDRLLYMNDLNSNKNEDKLKIKDNIIEDSIIDINIKKNCNIMIPIDQKVDIILSDLAPNLTGIWAVDIPKSMYLNELALKLVQGLLKKNGDFLIKLFNGEGVPKYLLALRKYFSKVIICKPKCSRKESREVYALAKGYKGL